MRFLSLFFVTVFAANALGAGASQVKARSATQLGVVAQAVASTGVTTNAITLDDDYNHFSQISFSVVAAVQGSTSYVEVKCKKSNTSDGTYTPVMVCDSSSPSACVEDKRRFTQATANFTSVWRRAGRFMKCTFYGDGNGTVTATAELLP